MQNFDLTILGSASARPTPNRMNSAQLVTYGNRHLLIDCGEGTQIRLLEMGINLNCLSDIFLSHLHGDHCFGLIGLLSSMGLMGRTADLVIHAHPDAERIFRPMIDYFCYGLDYPLRFDAFEPQTSSRLIEAYGLTVDTIPLRHSVPCAGFLVREKEQLPHIVRDRIDFYGIPTAYIGRIKNGENWIQPDGTVIPNERLTSPASPARSFAYCSDTAYSERILPYIEGVDTLYHEATFDASDEQRARNTFHSTAPQAATLALRAGAKRLLIGHYSSRYKTLDRLLDDARSVFPNTFLTEDKQRFKL